ncbi:purine nucleosidase/ribosylpyrimidine nucleosidase [Microterricola gilva]|uniref:Purine nucleosidase/ribosylpyrimidine nucleosidase n=1 Tax=Microterricola gilva TaxID=393267 RepID=A0A4Q8AR69_9MICO|nr:nucleoside hydrolase [Microterricola gilva]RZU66585.1 purine nucleosidase/ribosylpyrimidine nucleosidase [Microterricola gilva]
MRKIILDVDTGNDDAVAIMMAGLHPDLTLLGCTTVAGNLPVANTTENTLRVLHHIGRSDVPVFRGLGAPFAPHPFPTPAEFVSSATPVHQEELELAPSPVAVDPTPAVEWLVETLRAATERITLVPVGPLTNIAAAITIAPEIVDAVDEIVIMGGSASHGNETSQAEFNIFQDPVAAHVVMNAGFDRLTLVTLDATRHARVSAAQCRELEALGTAGAMATAQILDYYIRGNGNSSPDGAAVHDALCVAYLLDPAVIEVARLHVAIDTVGFHSYGRTLIDLTGISGQRPNSSVALKADSARFFELLRGTLAA